MSHLVGPVYDRRDFAGFWRRSAAVLIDIAVLVAIYIVFAFVWRASVPDVRLTPRRYAIFKLLWIIVWIAYWLGFRMTERGTPGYRLLRTRFAFMFAERPSRVWLLSRALWALVLFPALALDHLWILFDERKQALHDKIAGFYVVKQAARPTGTQPIVRRVMNVVGYTFVVWEPAKADAG